VARASRNRLALTGEPATGALLASRALLDACRVRHAAHVRVGRDARVIVAAARELGADRIVVGVGRDRSLFRLIDDALIDKVADFAPMPVDVVVGNSPCRFERIAVPVALAAALAMLGARLAD
jgi:hypothetical protein